MARQAGKSPYDVRSLKLAKPGQLPQMRQTPSICGQTSGSSLLRLEAGGEANGPPTGFMSLGSHGEACPLNRADRVRTRSPSKQSLMRQDYHSNATSFTEVGSV